MVQKIHCTLIGLALLGWIPLMGQESLSLEGTWNFRLDPDNVGLTEKWFDESLTDEVTLPGSLDEHGIGNPVTEIHMGKLTSETRYVGPAWYQKEVEIPESWAGRRIVLFLERANWETTVYVDGVHTPTQNSLSTPDIHDLTGMLSPGKHRITIQVDNTVKINLGHTYGTLFWLHALTEETQTNWNGMIGEISLVSTPKVWIRDMQLYPDCGKKRTRITVSIGNCTGRRTKGNLSIGGFPGYDAARKIEYTLSRRDTLIELQVPFDSSIRYWDEFDPCLYRVTATLKTAEGMDQKTQILGFRDFSAANHHFELNGRTVFLRGEVNCCVFPLTGYPPMEVDGWKKVLNTYRDYGLNHVRFHSWCPPSAAFQAADEMGFIFQVELPLWDGYGLVGSIPERAAYILAEADRIIETYGHHPSFCLLSMGNELGWGDDPFLAYLVDYLRKKDPRHLYTSTTHPADTVRSDDYFTAAGTTAGICRGTNPFNDFSERIEVLDRPMITHEVGFPAMYPDYREIEKYTGHLKPRNFEAFRRLLENKGMGSQALDFHKASGALAVEVYKENIEAQLRTRNAAGFQLLGLQDFPGQGTSIVGILDAFLDAKGLVSPEAWRSFCCPTVPLIRMPGFVYTSSQEFMAEAEVAHFGPQDLQHAAFQWYIEDLKGRKHFEGRFPGTDLPSGSTTLLGAIKADLSDVKKAEQFTLRVFLPGTGISNSWKIWVYPETGEPEIPKGILLTDKYDDTARATLENGGNVLLIPTFETLEHAEISKWHPVYWCYQLFHQPKGMGILCDPDHPALKEFPTDFHSDWQWQPLLDHSEALVIDCTPEDFRPIIQVVPDFNTNLKMSSLMEARVGDGGLMVCNIDLLHITDHPESARQLLKSVLGYMQSPHFRSAPALDPELVRELLRTSPVNPNASAAPDPSGAAVHIDAGANASEGLTTPWESGNDFDEVIRMEEAFGYSVKGSTYRDNFHSVWTGQNLVIRLSCPAGFKGSFYVFMKDQWERERAAHIYFCGQDKGPLEKYDRGGVWLKYRVTPEMSMGGELIFDARKLEGPDVTVQQVILIPE